MADERLEKRLREIGGLLDAPSGEGIAEAVGRRLEDERRPRRRFAPALIAASLAVVLGGAAFAVYVIQGVDIERVPTQPTVPGSDEPPRHQELALGRRATLDEAREAVDINVLVPERLGRPDAVYVGRRPQGGRVTLVYEPRKSLPEDPNTGVGMLVTMFRGTTGVDFVRKQLGPDTEVRPITVEDDPGMWITGAPHSVFYMDAGGEMFPDTLRLAENVLIWQDGDITVRLESRLGLDPSLEVATSMA